MKLIKNVLWHSCFQGREMKGNLNIDGVPFFVFMCLP
jgi:hypothetical protein